MVTVDLITGFLGSGKTTFLLKYARRLIDRGERICILEYDYGAINVDMKLLTRLRGANCEIEMLMAACDRDCLLRRFKTKLIAMAMSGYTRVIIEPSGIFDMDQFYDTLCEEPLDNWYEIGNVLTVVNAGLPENLSPEEDFLLASQAAGAGCILLSRVQNCTKEEIAATKEHIVRAAEAIRCPKLAGFYLEKPWDELTDEDYDRILSAGYHSNDYVKRISPEESSFTQVCFLNHPNSLSRLKEKAAVLFADSAYGEVLRIKGFAKDETKSYLVNATPTEINVDSLAAGQNELIVIGKKLNCEKITEYLMQ